MRQKPEVLVVGAGVSGLTTATCLIDQKYPVRVISREAPSESTSCAAGAIWGPYLADDERIMPWSEETRRVLVELAHRKEHTGVRMVYGHEAARADVSAPLWATDLEGFRLSIRDELPAGFTNGWWYEAPLVDMPAYLTYLLRRLRAAGVQVELGVVESLWEATAIAPIVVNCTGIGAYELAGDATVTSTRGQLVVVENPGVDRFFVEHDESPTPTYVLPHGDHLVLGGSAEPGRLDRTPDLAVSEAIVARCALVEPSVERARIVEHRVGLRPSRPRIRLERETLGQRHVVHNYGHGGSGVTVSWGCAREVARLIDEIYEI
jgi:D-amino-acid oxidase